MSKLDFKKMGGLIPVITQDHATNEILMQAFVDEVAVEKTLETGDAHYFSRSKNRIWKKGESSGHVQKIKEILVDCDNDSIVFKVEQLGGAACHVGYNSCFYRRITSDGSFQMLDKEKVFDPDKVYSH